jgi:hypothetical protein
MITGKLTPKAPTASPVSNPASMGMKNRISGAGTPAAVSAVGIELTAPVDSNT